MTLPLKWPIAALTYNADFTKEPAMTQEVVEILCDDPTNARYVRLRIIHGSRNVLNIAELEIYTK